MAKTKFLKELKTWSTPAFTERTVLKTLGKTLYRAGRFAFRRPLLTAAISYSVGRPLRRRKKYLKNKWGGGTFAGRQMMHKGKWLV